MDIRELRDKTMKFFIPLGAIVLIVGFSLWIIGTRYFWNTSTLTILTDPATPVTIRAEVQARIIKNDIPIPGLLHYAMTLVAREGAEVSRSYPVRYTLPWNKTVSCTGECVLERIPAGDMTLFVSYQGGESTFLEATILADTVGTIDIRPKIQLQYVTDVTKFLGTEPTKADRNLLPGSIIFMNSYQSLALIRASSGEYCFDVPTKQLIPLPDTLDSKKIIATEKDGVYIIMTNDTIHLFDRFGRTPLKLITHYNIGDVRLSWAGKYTELTYQKENIKLAGSWWPIKHDEKTYFTNGVKIFFIK